jgi:hypothetical protein
VQAVGIFCWSCSAGDDGSEANCNISHVFYIIFGYLEALDKVNEENHSNTEAGIIISAITLIIWEMVGNPFELVKLA